MPSLSYRHDIDGLRGLAIGLVVVFHVFIGRVSSGVDVFLFLGGMFFVGPQIRNALDPAGRTPLQSVVRLLRRLYPALLTVVTVTVAARLVISSRARRSGIAEDAAAALTYRQNLHLADEGHDYAAVSPDISLYQHLRSMAVQLQIYLAVLVTVGVVVGAVAATARTRRAGTCLLNGLLAAATVGSFCWAVHLHGADQDWNYYSPVSRFWEIGLGGLVGVLLLNRPLPAVWRRLRVPAGVAGVLLIAGTGLLLDGAAQFPGPWTLVPLSGAALVVAAGNPVTGSGAGTAAGTPVGVTRLLDGRTFQLLGRWSYSLYLWHWPVLVLATRLLSPGPDGTESSGDAGSAGSAGIRGITATLGTGRGLVTGTVVIVVSLVLARTTHRYIEDPLREHGRPARSWWPVRPAVVRSGAAVATVAVTAAGTVGVLATGPVVAHRDAVLTAATDPDHPDPADYPGPRALLEDAPVPEGPAIVPDVSDEPAMMPVSTTPDGCTASYGETEPVLTSDSGAPCAYGDVTADRSLYLAGNSHSEHFLAALDLIGRQRHIRVIPVLKAGCLLGAPLPKADGEPYPECGEWNGHARQLILDNPPTDGVFLNSTRPMNLDGRGPDHTPDGVVDLVRQFTAAGIHTWGMRDTPWPRENGDVVDPRLCVADIGEDSADSDCGSPRQEALAPVNPAVGAFRGEDADITQLDVSDALCDDERCPGVIGNTLVYRDSSHLTRTYAGMLAPEIDRQMFG